MGGISKRRIGAVAVAGMVVAGVAALSSMSASGQTPPQASGPVLIPYGTLTINLNSSGGSYVLDRAQDPDPAPEAISAVQPCATVEPGSGGLMVLSPTTSADTVQIRNNAFGVNTNNTSCGSSQAAVISGRERLTLALGPDLANVYIKSADLNVTRVKRGDVKYALDSLLDTDLITPPSPPAYPATINVDPLIATADDLFRSITIASTSTRDGEGVSIATGTTFELVTLDPNFDIAVDCGEAVPSPGPGDIATSATYERLDNKNQDPESCEEVGVRVQIQDQDSVIPFDRVFWNNDFVGVNGGSEQNVQAYFTIVWAATSELTDLDREIDYTGTASAGTPMLWCGPEENGVPTLPSYSGAGAIEFTPNTPGPDLRAPWCLVNDERALQADGRIVQTQKLFGSGDPWAR